MVAIWFYFLTFFPNALKAEERIKPVLAMDQRDPSAFITLQRTRATLLDKTLRQGKLRLIVGFTLPNAPLRTEGRVSEVEWIEAQRGEIAQQQQNILHGMDSVHVTATHRYPYIPFLAVEADAAGLEALINHPSVTYIQEDRPIPPDLSDSVPLIDGDTAWSSGYSGAGQTVAILDTGVQSSHPFLSGKVVAEACYSWNSTSYGSTSVCPNGQSSQVGPGSGVNCNASISGCSHGTHVAGIVAGRGTSFSGVAKDANLIAVQVFSQFSGSSNCGSSSPCVMSWESDYIAGLQYVYSLRSTYNIASVNMSLGGGKYTSQSSCDSSNYATKAAIDNLRAANIATIIASGNSYYSDGLSEPGCISTAVSVGATTKSDGIASYSNSASFLSLLAPGSSIYSSVLTNSYAYYSGTSMATPHVAGAWAVLKQKKPSATVSEILSAFQTTGKSILDSRNSISKPRIDIDNALAITGVTTTTTTTLPATVTVNATSITAGQSVTVTVNNGPGNPTDWVGLATYGSATSSFLAGQWQYLNGTKTPPATGSKSATLTFTIPSAGSYEFRLFSNNSTTMLARSQAITVSAVTTSTILTTTSTILTTTSTISTTSSSTTSTTLISGGNPTVTVNPLTAAAGQSITVTIANGPGNKTDWVGLAFYGSATNSYIPGQWQYLNGTKTPPATGLKSATLTFTIPTAGSYEFRLFSNNSYTLLARSQVVTVAAGTITSTTTTSSTTTTLISGGNPTVNVNTYYLTAGQTVFVTVANGPGNRTDWVGLALSGSPDYNFVVGKWLYLNGAKTPPLSGLTGATLAFTVPSPGIYEFRFYANNSYYLLGRSHWVVVS